MRQTRAYNELVGILLRPEDQQRFEWIVGAMLNDGPKNIVAFRGEAGTGKTTLLNIVRKIAMTTVVDNFAPRVAFVNWDHRYELPSFENEFVFTECYGSRPIRDGVIVIETTGDRVPVNKHHVLTQEIDNELPEIARGCSAVYNSLGENYDITNLENNR